jgi:ParB family transcriptional regulator, chromosome partitioning protein
MTKKGEGWISRRGQADAASAVELVLDRQPQEQLLQIADELIEDSPYQARQPISDASVSELALGMEATGFQGVLIVRPHGDAVKRRKGVFQLVYGHRRRTAWRSVCQKRGEPCMLPVVVRDVTDAQMLTIGAQENLQRQDLDPLEEAQIVAWAERMFFDKNQAEIGAMLGKSEDWVRLRSRVAKLPDVLKDRLRVRPRAMSQILELATLYREDAGTALALADRVVSEQLTLDRVRQLVRSLARPVPASSASPPTRHDSPSAEADAGELHRGVCERKNDRGGAAAIVTPGTKETDALTSARADHAAPAQLQCIHVAIAATHQQVDILRTLRQNIREQSLAPSTAQTFAALLGTLTAEIDAFRTAAGELSDTLGGPR